MVTVAEAVEETISHLGGDNSPVVWLAEASGLDNDTVVFDSVDGITPGVELELGGLERVLVRSVDDSAGEVTMARGWAGTSAVEHPAGEVVRVSPVVFRGEVFREIQNTVRHLTSVGMYKVASAPVEFDYSTFFFDATEVEEVVSFYSLLIDDGSTVYERFDFSEVGDQLLRPQFYPPRTNAEVAYKARLTVPSSLTDDLVDDVGLPETAVDLPALGAAARLWLQTTGKRVQIRAHSQHRRAEDVTPVDVARQGTILDDQLAGRISEELRGLRRQYPLRMSSMNATQVGTGRGWR